MPFESESPIQIRAECVVLVIFRETTCVGGSDRRGIGDPEIGTQLQNGGILIESSTLDGEGIATGKGMSGGIIGISEGVLPSNTGAETCRQGPSIHDLIEADTDERYHLILAGPLARKSAHSAAFLIGIGIGTNPSDVHERLQDTAFRDTHLVAEFSEELIGGRIVGSCILIIDVANGDVAGGIDITPCAARAEEEVDRIFTHFEGFPESQTEGNIVDIGAGATSSDIHISRSIASGDSALPTRDDVSVDTCEETNKILIHGGRVAIAIKGELITDGLRPNIQTTIVDDSGWADLHFRQSGFRIHSLVVNLLVGRICLTIESVSQVFDHGGAPRCAPADDGGGDISVDFSRKGIECLRCVGFPLDQDIPVDRAITWEVIESRGRRDFVLREIRHTVSENDVVAEELQHNLVWIVNHEGVDIVRAIGSTAENTGDSARGINHDVALIPVWIILDMDDQIAVDNRTSTYDEPIVGAVSKINIKRAV